MIRTEKLTRHVSVRSSRIPRSHRLSRHGRICDPWHACAASQTCGWTKSSTSWGSWAAYIRAEQELGRIRDDIDAVEAAAVVISVPFARAMEHALTTIFMAPAHFPDPETAALDILARGLAPLPD